MTLATRLVLLLLPVLAPPPGAQEPGAPPVGEVVWEGAHLFRGEPLDARLYLVESRPGARSSGIDQTLALSVHPPEPDGSLLLVIGGGRDLQALRSFGREIELGDVDLGRFLERGYAIAFLEYRGSKTPGGGSFAPPLPDYGELIRGYDEDDACEYGVGDAYDVVAAARFLMSGQAFPVDSERVFAAGGSHGGYLALRLARDVEGLAGVVAAHPPTDLRGSLAWILGAPTYPHPQFLLQSPGLALNFPVEGTTARREYERFIADLGGRSRARPGDSLLASPPRCERILLLHNVDDFLVPVANSRWYVERWRPTNPGVLYAEFTSRQVAELFPASADDVKRKQLLSTHAENVSGSALERPLMQTLGLEEGEPELRDSLVGPLRVDARFALVAEDGELDLQGAEVVVHDLDSWAPLAPLRGRADTGGVASIAGVPVGYQLVDVALADGERSWADLWVYVRQEEGVRIRVMLRDGS